MAQFECNFGLLACSVVMEDSEPKKKFVADKAIAERPKVGGQFSELVTWLVLAQTRLRMPNE